VLQLYLQADNPSSQESALSELMEKHAQPIVRRVVLARLAGLWDDIDDVCSEVRLELLLRLRRVKTDPNTNAIADFPAYVATVAANACNQYFRRRRPGRARLKKQIRFLVSQEPELESNPSADGRVWCGLAGRDVAAMEMPGRLRGRGASPANINDIVAGIEADHDLGRLVTGILTRASTPLELDALTDIVAGVWRIPQDPYPAGSSVPVESIPAAFAEPELVIDRRRFTARLWEEIRQLPRSQRVALLLHLRDQGGNSVLFLFPLCGVASVEQIASTLEIKEETLSELWNRLPLDDLSIGSLLSCARQQVINLRMAARKRLANRMRALR
jgi:RNA polymerase sigma factor (sigma-70 family)